MTNRILTLDNLNDLAENTNGSVALTRRHYLKPVADDRIVFPPTFAGGNYAMDTLSDGTRTVIIDTVGSQANRMEELFILTKSGPHAEFVPQVNVEIEREKYGEKTSISIMEAGHRLGDALIRASELATDAGTAFATYKAKGDAGPIAKLSPTTLVFGAWDSRDTQAKMPRLVQSTVRAWDVDDLKRSAQYAPPIDYNEWGVFTEAEVKDKSERGYGHIPSVNTHGGVYVNGAITRDVTVNLIALRQLDSNEKGDALRGYILGLTLLSAMDDLDGFYRQGCLLTPDPDAPSPWKLIDRNGTREDVQIDQEAVKAFTKTNMDGFGKGPDKTVKFDKKLAQADSKKKK